MSGNPHPAFPFLRRCSNTEGLVLMALWAYADLRHPSPEVWVAGATLAEKLGVPERTVRRALAGLEGPKVKAIVRTERTGLHGARRIRLVRLDRSTPALSVISQDMTTGEHRTPRPENTGHERPLSGHDDRRTPDMVSASPDMSDRSPDMRGRLSGHDVTQTISNHDLLQLQRRLDDEGLTIIAPNQLRFAAERAAENGGADTLVAVLQHAKENFTGAFAAGNHVTSRDFRALLEAYNADQVRRKSVVPGPRGWYDD